MNRPGGYGARRACAPPRAIPGLGENATDLLESVAAIAKRATKTELRTEELLAGGDVLVRCSCRHTLLLGAFWTLEAKRVRIYELVATSSHTSSC